MTVRRGSVPRALIAALTVIAALLVVAPAMAKSRRRPGSSGGLRQHGCRSRGMAVRDLQGAARLRPSGRRLHEDRRHAPAGQDQAHRIGALFINYGGPGGDAVATTQAIGVDLFGAVNERFDIVAFDPRGVGESSPVDRLQGQPGDAGALLGAVHDAREPRRERAARARTRPTSSAASQLNKDILPHVVDRQRGARHGRDPRAAGRQEAQLLRLLVRHVPRRDLLEPVPGQLPGDGARRPDRRERLHQQARGGPARAVGRLRARARPLLPGLRPGPGRVPASAAPIRGRPTTRSSTQADALADPGRRLHATTRGRSTATTSSAAR